jgi:hypothetical protein
MDSLPTALAGLALDGQEPIHGADQAAIAAFIVQRGASGNSRPVIVAGLLFNPHARLLPSVTFKRRAVAQQRIDDRRATFLVANAIGTVHALARMVTE